MIKALIFQIYTAIIWPGETERKEIAEASHASMGFLIAVLL